MIRCRVSCPLPIASTRLAKKKTHRSLFWGINVKAQSPGALRSGCLFLNQCILGKDLATSVAVPAQIRHERRSTRGWWLLPVTLATFMELLDTSIANVSLPYIGGGLGRSFDEVTWILTTYLVANAVVLPMSAWLSRVFGRKNYYMACVGLFTIASLCCGLAPTLGIMLAARVFQGVGEEGWPR